MAYRELTEQEKNAFKEVQEKNDLILGLIKQVEEIATKNQIRVNVSFGNTNDDFIPYGTSVNEDGYIFDSAYEGWQNSSC